MESVRPRFDLFGRFHKPHFGVESRRELLRLIDGQTCREYNDAVSFAADPTPDCCKHTASAGRAVRLLCPVVEVVSRLSKRLVLSLECERAAEIRRTVGNGVQSPSVRQWRTSHWARKSLVKFRAGHDQGITVHTNMEPQGVQTCKVLFQIDCAGVAWPF